MIEALGKYVGGKVLSAVLAVAVILVVVWYWRLTPVERADLWRSVRYVFLWLGFAAVLPWATFFVPPMVVRTESNLISAAALLGYLLVDVLFALWLAGWGVESRLAWAVMIVGFLAAGVYNFVVCEFLADRSEEAL